MLLVAIALTSIMVLALSMAFQPLVTRSQRMKERELIYRGQHLAEGIRRFYFKFRRFPFELDELVESEPRMVRKLYADPMTPSGEWDLIYLTSQDRLGVKGLGAALTGNDDEASSGDQTGLAGQADSLFSIKTKQIVGVRSKSRETGFRVYQESQIYADWTFSALPSNVNALPFSQKPGQTPMQTPLTH